MIYTVLIYHEDFRQIAAHHVEANDGMTRSTRPLRSMAAS